MKTYDPLHDGLHVDQRTCDEHESVCDSRSGWRSGECCLLRLETYETLHDSLHVDQRTCDPRIGWRIGWRIGSSSGEGCPRLKTYDPLH